MERFTFSDREYIKKDTDPEAYDLHIKMTYRELSIAALFAEVKLLHRRLEHQESKLHSLLGQSNANNNNKTQVSSKQHNSPKNNRKVKYAGYMQPTKARIAAVPQLPQKSIKSPRTKVARIVPNDSSPPAPPKQLDIKNIQQILEDDNIDMSILLEVKDLLTISIKQSEAWLTNVDSMLANADDARPPSTYHHTVQKLLSYRQDEPVIIFRSPVERKIALVARKNIEYTQDEPSLPSPTSRPEFTSSRQPSVLSNALKTAQENHDHDLDTNIRMLIERQATYFNQRESALITLQDQQLSSQERYEDQFEDFSSSLLSPLATVVPPSHEEKKEEERDIEAFRSTLTTLRSRLDLLLVEDDGNDNVITNEDSNRRNDNDSIDNSSKLQKKKLRRKKKQSNTRNLSNASPVSDNSSIQSSYSSSTIGSGRMRIILPKMNSKSLAAREVILERAEVR